ncbi:c-type cytochrome [Roseovarius salinarum]|uniref:c-type cytochrome n=1 Tax=Roseovarius salinarum TaxID=1981892 RepID=UPI001E2E3B57|nr:cytochrome c family protein [Roseovarius salinarum]
MVAAADPADGEGVFRQCQACHKLEEGQHGVGPSLYDVVGEKVASVEDFRYSNALKDKGGEWTAERLSAWLENPQDFASGTTMGYAGLADAEDRAAVIAYMDAADGTHDIAAASSSDADAAADAQPADEDGAAGGEATQEDAAGDDGAAEQGAAEDGAAADDEAMTDGASTEEAASDTGGAAQSEIAAMVAAADPADGKNVFNRCRACHKLEEGQNGVGPHLYGVVGSDVASVEDFRYSSALEDLGGKWTPERMDAWLENPRDFAPGNKMSFAGLRDAEDRAAVIAYMQSVAE